MTVPDSINIERGRLLDVITDMQQYFYGRKVALAGDPDQLISLTEFLVSIDMWPIHIVTGTPGKKFEARIKEITKDVPHPVNVKSAGRHVPAAPVDQKRPGGPADGQHLHEVHRPG